jgi:hypothetical protein
LLDRSIATEGYIIREPSAPYGDEHWIDLSNIDFEKLAEKFKTGCKRTMNEKLKGTVAPGAPWLKTAPRFRFFHCRDRFLPVPQGDPSSVSRWRLSPAR